MGDNRAENTYAYANGNGSHTNDWGFMISRDKAAAPNFDLLCRGLAQLIRNLEPKHDVDLSPSRLAAFYRSVGADFDDLFFNTGEHGLSFLYRTLGCYHSLQPTTDAFQTPNIPCLTDDGFVRWQTLQMLLDPNVHAAILQKAVQVYDVPKPTGGTFPKIIPRECFPAQPDKAMESWHRFVTSQMNQESYMRRLKLSPYHSPHADAIESPGGYFGRGSQNRPSHGSRRESAHEERARIEEMRRRSSVPALSPDPPDAASPYNRNLAKSPRSHSENRPNTGDSARSQHARSRSSTFNTSYHSPDHRPSPTHPPRRHPNHRDPYSTRSDRDRNRRPSSRNESGEDASSDESRNSRRNRSSGDERKRKSRWASSLMPSFFLSSNKRRHSSDGRVPSVDSDDRSPRRNDSFRKNKPGKYLEAPTPQAPRVSFKSNVFSEGDLPLSSNEPPQPSYVPPPSAYRHSEPQTTPMRTNLGPDYPYPSPRPIETDSQAYMRKAGAPTRVHTVSGVNGRRYAGGEMRSPVANRRRDDMV